jgi:hypothetical protein
MQTGCGRWRFALCLLSQLWPGLRGAHPRSSAALPGKKKNAGMLPPQLEKQKKFEDENAVVVVFLTGRPSHMVQFETVHWLMPKLVSMEEREYP